jgi:hypothetical protein
MLYEVIKQLYPNIPDTAFSLRDDGNGPFIEQWRHNLPQPTQEQIDAGVPVVPAAPVNLTEAAHTRINIAYDAAVHALTAGYPQTEIDSWSKQESEARAWQLNRSSPTPWIDAAATARDITRDSLAVLILNNANALAPIHGALTGKRQLLRDAINALGPNATQEQLDLIQWS